LSINVKEDLRRELGFGAALTIGAGTMIGAGIFLLSGIAISLAGPAAIFSFIAAGIVCIVTAASAAELATGMPTSGGDYFFVSRSLGPSFGDISGYSLLRDCANMDLPVVWPIIHWWRLGARCPAYCWASC